MIAAIGEGKTLHRSRWRPRRTTLHQRGGVVARQPGRESSSAAFRVADRPDLGRNYRRRLERMSAGVEYAGHYRLLGYADYGVERPAADFRAKLPGSSHLRSSLRVTGAELCPYGSSKAPLFAMPCPTADQSKLIHVW